MVVTLAQFAVFFGYLLIVHNRFGIQESISKSAYAWESQKRDRKYYFMAMCWALAILNLFQDMGTWGFLTSASLFFTGITTDFLENRAHSLYLHYVGAIGAISCSLIGLWALHGIWIPAIVFVIASVITYRFSGKNYIWWIEVEAFILILTGYRMR